jgi:hypothetical protein
MTTLQPSPSNECAEHGVPNDPSKNSLRRAVLRGVDYFISSFGLLSIEA